MFQTPSNEEEVRAGLKKMIQQLMAYVQTPEGEAHFEQLDAVLRSIEERQRPKKPELTPLEEKALRFMQRQQRKGKFPTIREVTKAVGRKSSRTGMRILCRLRQGGYLT